MRSTSLSGLLSARPTISRLPATMQRVPWADAGALLVLAACAASLFRGVLSEGKIFWELDTILFYYPQWDTVRQALLAGRLPLWTPDIFGGHPLLADGEAGMLYPIHLLLWFLLPTLEGFVAGSMLHVFLGGAFTYGFLRALRLSPLAALLGGLAFSQGSFLIGQLHHLNVVACIIWLPLALRYAELSLQQTGRRRWTCAVLAGAAMGLSLLTLHVNAWLMAWLVLGSYVAYRYLTGPVSGGEEGPASQSRLARRLIVGGGFLTVAALLSLGLGAVQFLPTWELAQQSPRYAGVDYRFATSFALPPVNLVTLIAPYFFRQADNLYWSPWFRWDNTVYVGIAPLLLALLAVALRRSRITLYFLLLTVAGLLLAMGDYLPVSIYAWLWRLPLFSMTRVPSRFLFFATLGLAVLAAIGLDALRDALVRTRKPASAEANLAVPPRSFLGRAADWQAGSPRRGLLAVLAVFLIVTLLLGWALPQAHAWALANPQEVAALLERHYPRNTANPGLDFAAPNRPEALTYSLDVFSAWTPRTLLWLAAASVLLGLWYCLRPLAALWRLLLLALLIVDLVPFAVAYHPRMGQAGLQPPAGLTAYLQQHSGEGRTMVAWPVTSVGPNRLTPLHVPEAAGYSSLITKRYSDMNVQLERWPARFLDVLGVRYLVATSRSDSLLRIGASAVYTEGEVSVFERTSSLPRARMVYESVAASSAAGALATVASGMFPAERSVVLEGVAAPLPASGAPPGPAQIVRSEPERVTVRVEAADDGYLVLSDTYYPGWEAFVDGRPAPILRANSLFRAVALGAGSHQVDFVFVSAPVGLGGLVTLVTGAAALLALLLAAAGRHAQARAHDGAGGTPAPGGEP